MVEVINAEIEEMKKKLGTDLVHTIAWEKDDFRQRYVYLDGNECSVVAKEMIASPYESVEVDGAVRFFMQDGYGNWVIENDEIKKEWKVGRVKWEYIKMHIFPA